MQCYGDLPPSGNMSASEYLAYVKSKEVQTVNTSNGIMKAWDDAGGNTPLVSKTPPTFMDNASNIFSKIWGILSLPQTPAETSRKTVVVESPKVPLAAFAAVGMLAYVVYKVGKS